MNLGIGAMWAQLRNEKSVQFSLQLHSAAMRFTLEIAHIFIWQLRRDRLRNLGVFQ